MARSIRWICRRSSSPSATEGITIQNNTSYDIIIAVANKVLGVSVIGYARNGGKVTLTVTWAWRDVYALTESESEAEFMSAAVISTINCNYQKKNVGYRDTVTIP